MPQKGWGIGASKTQVLARHFQPLALWLASSSAKSTHPMGFWWGSNGKTNGSKLSFEKVVLFKAITPIHPTIYFLNFCALQKCLKKFFFIVLPWAFCFGRLESELSSKEQILSQLSLFSLRLNSRSSQELVRHSGFSGVGEAPNPALTSLGRHISSLAL